MRATIIILLFLLSVSLQAADMPAPMLGDQWSIRSDLLLIGLHHPNPVQFVSTLTRDRLIKTPVWQQESEYPPLSPRKAEDLALAMLHEIMGERHWDTPDISLRAFDVTQGASGHRDIRWIYILRFQLVPITDYESGALSIVVLMDGTAIEPKRVDERRFIPESTNRPPNTALEPTPTAPRKTR